MCTIIRLLWLFNFSTNKYLVFNVIPSGWNIMLNIREIVLIMGGWCILYIPSCLTLLKVKKGEGLGYLHYYWLALSVQLVDCKGTPRSTMNYFHQPYCRCVLHYHTLEQLQSPNGANATQSMLKITQNQISITAETAWRKSDCLQKRLEHLLKRLTVASW